MRTFDVPGPTSRPCLTCGESFPLTLEHWPFDAMGRGGTRPHCLSCYNRKRRDAYARDPEPTRERMRQRRAERTAHFRRALTPRGQGLSSFPETED
ncbi:hypothetical protein GCM10011578_083250 [Streptomyces fuscichromogenes]|uniref:Uncharacterized protein n=1 Tax=Streptomyces fuscichromogenes TaxID=1324013 RepID=A0A918CWC2_9ACTN|nr:hypothetical protein GCM10011578_083250 [Streptomyces fuscichromogenes]